MMGYDVNPPYNKKGELAWLSMKRDGYEADKQDIIVSNGITKLNLTQQRDDIHVEGFSWSEGWQNNYFSGHPSMAPCNYFKCTYPGAYKNGTRYYDRSPKVILILPVL